MDLGDFSSLLLLSALPPSITSLCILLLISLQLGPSRLRTDDVLTLQFRVALVFSALGILLVLGTMFGIDLAGSLSGKGSAVTPVAILLAFVGVACVQRSFVIVGWLLLVLVSFEMRLTGAENIWRYLIDPFALCYAVAFVIWHRQRLTELRLEKTTLQR